MISEKINSLFKFIDFLNSNIINFNKYDKIMNELYFMGNERDSLDPQSNDADKINYDKIQSKISNKLKIININVIVPINEQVKKLGICDITNAATISETMCNWNMPEIQLFKQTPNIKDRKQVMIFCKKYIEFKVCIKSNFFQHFLFQDLDRILNVLFSYFNQNYESDIKELETEMLKKAIINKTKKLTNEGKELGLISQYDKMKECGFDNESIERLLIKDYPESRLINNHGVFLASNLEGKIYSGKEAIRKMWAKDVIPYFPKEEMDLIPEYFRLKQDKYCNEKKQSAGQIFNENKMKEIFRNEEIIIIKNTIEDRRKYLINPAIKNEIDKYTHYLYWLEDFENHVLKEAETGSKNELTTNNDFVSIKLGEYKDKFSSEYDYNEAVRIIHEYFNAGKATCKSPIFIRNGNIKNIAYAMGEIWRSQKNEVITYDYLLLYKKLFTIFNKHEVKKGKVFHNKLYKYSITKT
jgi:hypothetical protein